MPVPQAGEGGLALVLGGSGAIGQEIAQQLVRQGIRVIATYCHSSPPESPAIRWVRAEVYSGSLDALADEVASANTILHTFIYAVGEISSKSTVVETSADEWIRLFGIHCVGFTRVYRALSAPLRQSRASVVAISSNAVVTRSARNGPYTAAKAALESIVETLAVEEAPYGVRVNAIAPSLVKSPSATELLRIKGITDATQYEKSQPWGRMLSAAEVARSALWLALDSSMRYTTGQVIRLTARTG